MKFHTNLFILFIYLFIYLFFAREPVRPVQQPVFLPPLCLFSIAKYYAMLCTIFLREMVKTILLRQDPPFRKKTGGLFVYPPSPTLKDGVLFV